MKVSSTTVGMPEIVLATGFLSDQADLHLCHTKFGGYWHEGG